eukprot:scaffold368878_cov33-Prasinocladus_malaysianus.AAC.1
MQSVAVIFSGEIQDICAGLIPAPDRFLRAIYNEAAEPGQLEGGMPAGCMAGNKVPLTAI